MTKPWCFTILSSTRRWRLDLAKTTNRPYCPIERWRCGFSATRMRPRPKPTTLSVTPAMIGHAGTIMNTLPLVTIVPFLCGDDATTEGRIDELIALAEEKNALFWKMFATVGERLLVCYDRQSRRSDPNNRIGNEWVFVPRAQQMFEPWWLLHLGWAHAELGATR
jgi:hypothetical protein